MVLHTLNQPPANAACLDSALSAMAPGDTLLLIEDGVYWALPVYESRFAAAEITVLVLDADITARGVKPSTAECVDDAGFVALCVSHEKVVSWF